MSLKSLKSHSDSTSLTVLSSYEGSNYDYCIDNSSSYYSSSVQSESNTNNFLQASYAGDKEVEKYKFLSQIRKNFKSMYVLSFVQAEDIFEYFKTMIDEEVEEENVMSYRNKGKKKEKCKYLHLIVQNPFNKAESVEIGVKIIDIIHSKLSY